MRCPRCQRASPDEAVFCPGCGAPLALRAEPAPRPLDLSISLDRRAGARELSLDPPREPGLGHPWDLRGRLGLAAATAPSAAFEADGDDEIQFGPVPELAPDPEPGPGAALPPALGVSASPPEPGPDAPAFAAPRPFARALGLAPDPVVPDDLGLAAIADAAAEPLADSAPTPAPGRSDPADGLAHALDLDRDLAVHAASAGAARERAPELDRDHDHADRVALAGAVRERVPDLGHALDRDPAVSGALSGGAREGLPAHGGALDLGPLRGPSAGAALDRDLDLALEIPGRPDERELDVSLSPSAQPDQLPLPLVEAAPRARGARPARRAAAWAVDVAPLAVLWVTGLAALYARVPLSPGDQAGVIERVLSDGGALALPLLAAVGTLGLVHQTLAHALAGATLGKWLLGLRVVCDDGERPAVGRCAARAALSAASVLLLGLGLAPALFTRSGRALHDISAGTRVVEAP